jgi:hypothetical protein
MMGEVMRQSAPFSEALMGKIRRPSVCSGELMEASALAAGLNHASLRERLRAKKR